MSGAYVAKAAATPDVCGSGPSGWNPFWLFPGPPWAPGWPIGIPAGYTLGLTLGTVSVGAAAALVANVLFNGLDDSNLQCHALQITAQINGVTLQVSNDNVTFSNSLSSSVKNYTGTKYGFSKNLYLQLSSANIGQSGSITVTNISTNPAFSATVNFTVAGYNVVATSSDGTHRVQAFDGVVTWTPETTPANSLFSICWSPDKAIFVAVGNSGTVLTSPDGVVWTPQTAALSSGWISVCWSPAQSLFVAVSSTAKIMTSPDGVNWAQQTFAPAVQLSSVFWSPDVNLFVATASNAAADRIYTSPTGVTWTPQTCARGRWSCGCWAHELSKFVVIGFDSPNQVGISTNGTAWSVTPMITPAQTWFSIAWNGSVFVAVGTGVSAISTDGGVTWALTTPAEANTWASVCWSASLGLFVAVASNGTHRVMVSSNGINWTPQSVGEQNAMSAVCSKS